MNLVWLSMLCLGQTLAVPEVKAAPAQDAARQIIRQAIEAEGGEERLGQSVASVSRSKGTVHSFGEAPFTCENYSSRGNRIRQVMQLNANTVTRIVLVLDGTHGWVSYDGRTEELDAETLADTRTESYVNHVTNLVGLLKEPGFQLSLLAGKQVQGRPAVGINVVSKGHPDVQLYFDRESGLLVERAYKARERGDGRPSSRVSIYADYREAGQADSEEQTLRQARLEGDGPSLIRYLREHTPETTDLERMQTLVRQLGDRRYRKRELAAEELRRIGEPAVPFLEQATRDPDLEVARRAKACLEKIQRGQADETAVAVVRLIGLRRPAGGAEALLAYLPCAPNESVAAEIRYALTRLAAGKGEAEAALRRALDSPQAVCREAASEALGLKPASAGVHRVFLSGVKLPHRIITYHGGEKSMEYEMVDIQYFNRLDDRLFHKP